MTTPNLQRAEEFIWTSARLLDRQRFAFHFLGGTHEPVLAALVAYQNADGGFGNALEPDMRTPHSQPCTTVLALQILDEIGWDQDVALRVCDYLDTITTAEGGVPWVLPTVMDYPRAPWWQTDAAPPASLNPTAGIAALLDKHGVAHPWLDLATEYCWQALEGDLPADVHSLLEIVRFLQHVPDRERAEEAFKRVAEQIFAAKLVALEPDAPGYVKKPLDWAPRPDSLSARLFPRDVMAAHLDALVARQQEDGGWPISWPAVSPAGESEWRGALTVDALLTLRAYGRLA